MCHYCGRTMTWANNIPHIDLISDILFYTGGTILLIGMLPFIYQIWKNKRATDVTYIYLITQIIVNIMFVIYAIIRVLWPMLYTNGGMTIILIIMGVLKVYYECRAQPIDIDLGYDIETGACKPTTNVDIDECSSLLYEIDV